MHIFLHLRMAWQAKKNANWLTVNGSVSRNRMNPSIPANFNCLERNEQSKLMMTTLTSQKAFRRSRDGLAKARWSQATRSLLTLRHVSAFLGSALGTRNHA